jgi:hypothetical protein
MVKELITFMEDTTGNSYSSLARGSSNWENIKPLILSDLSENLSMKWDDCINLFIREEKNWNYFKDRVDQINANVDRFIYDLWTDIKKSNPNFRGVKPTLGGDEYGSCWTNIHFRYDDIDKTEFMYKYLYGFHKTEYGQALIASQNVDLVDFIKTGNENFDWVEFNQYLKNSLKYYIGDLEFKIDLDHWNNDYLIFENMEIAFYYENYMEDNGWFSLYDPEKLEKIKKELIKIIYMEIGGMWDSEDSGEILFISQMPKKIWHRAENPKKL